MAIHISPNFDGQVERRSAHRYLGFFNSQSSLYHIRTNIDTHTYIYIYILLKYVLCHVYNIKHIYVVIQSITCVLYWKIFFFVTFYFKYIRIA